MRYHRFWIEILVLGTLVACILALLIATVGAAAGAAAGEKEVAHAVTAAPAEPEQSFEGMVTCSRCGAKHSAALDRSASTCVRICVHGGASFALVEDDSVYILDGDVSVLKKLAGQRADILGTRSGGTIKVVSASAKS